MEQIQVEGCSDFDCGRIGKRSVLGWRMSKHGIRSLVIVVLLMIPTWIAAVKFLASLWEVFHG
ncbi:TPA: hypothetical protein NY115_000938 [Klebsiella michiganensis]|nr:hypothetical protein [Klebsiella michiganensis]